MKVFRDRVSIDAAFSPSMIDGAHTSGNGIHSHGETKKKKTLFRKIKDEIRRAKKRVSGGVTLLAGSSPAIDVETNRAVKELQVANRQLQDCVTHLQERFDQLEKLVIGNHNAASSNGTGNPSEGILVKVESGFVVCPPHEPMLLSCLRDSGDLERGTRLLIERILRPGDTFVDVGSHVGLHSVAAARSLEGQGKVYAFEPSSTTHAFLQRSVQANGFQGLIETFQCAVSDHVGEQRFYLAPVAGHQSLFPLYEDQVDSDNFELVRTIPLDAALPAETKVRLLKIDAEGAEILVVKGANQTIQSNPNIGLIVEFGVSHLERTGVSLESWFQAFEDLQLVFRVIEPLSGRLEDWSIAQLMEVESANLLFARPEADIWALV